MAKGRMINKRIAKSDRLASLKTDRARVIYFMIYPHLDVAGRFSGDPRDIKEDCCPRLPYTLKQIAESIIDLDRVGLLELYEDQPGRAVIEYYRYEDFQELRKDREAESEYVSPRKSDGYEKTPGVLPEGSRRTPLLYLSLSLSLSSIIVARIPVPKKGKGQSKTPDAEQSKLIASVVAYLNEKSGKKFSATGKETAAMISARFSEGFTLNDFKKVIDIKAAKWKGDPKMDDYLRPSTLFRPTHFEEYLNEAIPGRQKQVGENVPQSAADKTRDAKLRVEYEDAKRKFMKAKGYKTEDDIPLQEDETFEHFKARRLREATQEGTLR